MLRGLELFFMEKRNRSDSHITFVGMQLSENVSLKPYNSFGIDVSSDFFTELKEESQIPELSDLKPGLEKKVLGGGSNILLTEPVRALVIHNGLKGIHKLAENDSHVWLQVKAGEVWQDLVTYSIHENLSGLENLSLIPGCVGAAPMQNIGAYGAEAKDTIEEVMAWHWQEKRFFVLKNQDCRFGYRNSIFKQELKDKALITSVVFRLDKIHCLNTGYGAIRHELEKMGVSEPTVKSVSEAVMAIRTSKLPDPRKIGNAGSFFKNPTVSGMLFQDLKSHYPAIPHYPLPEGMVKIPAGWLIEQAGWKGYREGDAGVHEKQALVLVNYGQASGKSIYSLSEKIARSVKQKFGIQLEREVNIW